MRFKIILLGLISFLIAVIATIPIAFVLPFLPEKIPVRLTEASGTVWKGQATSLYYKNIALGQVHWEIHPLAIFMGRLRSDLIITGDKVQLNSLVDVHWDKSVQLSQTHAEFDADFLQNFKKIPIKLGGRFNADMTSVLIKAQQLPLMEGQLKWLKGSTVTPIAVELGNYTLALTVLNDAQQGSISSHDAPLDLQGKLSLDQQGNYQTKLKIKAKQDAPALLQTGITSLGKVANDGFIPLNQKGNIYKLLP